MKIRLPDPNKEKKGYIKIEPWDTWSMEYTLAKIIYPMLKQLKKTGHGTPITNFEDVPEELRPTEILEDQWDTDSLFFKRWDWIMDEMIWAFREVAKGRTWDNYTQEYNARMDNAFRLFGVYYRGLWD